MWSWSGSCIKSYVVIPIDETNQDVAWETGFVVVSTSDQVLHPSRIIQKRLVIFPSHLLGWTQRARIQESGVRRPGFVFSCRAIVLTPLSEIKETVNYCLVTLNHSQTHIHQELVLFDLSVNIKTEHILPDGVLESSCKLQGKFFNLEIHCVGVQSVYQEDGLQMESLFRVEVKVYLYIAFIVCLVERLTWLCPFETDSLTSCHCKAKFVLRWVWAYCWIIEKT
jgi:hypothetical protein